MLVELLRPGTWAQTTLMSSSYNHLDIVLIIRILYLKHDLHGLCERAPGDRRLYIKAYYLSPICPWHTLTMDIAGYSCSLCRVQEIIGKIAQKRSGAKCGYSGSRLCPCSRCFTQIAFSRHCRSLCVELVFRGWVKLVTWVRTLTLRMRVWPALVTMRYPAVPIKESMLLVNTTK